MCHRAGSCSSASSRAWDAINKGGLVFKLILINKNTSFYCSSRVFCVHGPPVFSILEPCGSLEELVFDACECAERSVRGRPRGDGGAHVVDATGAVRLQRPRAKHHNDCVAAEGLDDAPGLQNLGVGTVFRPRKRLSSFFLSQRGVRIQCLFSQKQTPRSDSANLEPSEPIF